MKHTGLNMAMEYFNKVCRFEYGYEVFQSSIQVGIWL